MYIYRLSVQYTLWAMTENILYTVWAIYEPCVSLHYELCMGNLQHTFWTMKETVLYMVWAFYEPCVSIQYELCMDYNRGDNGHNGFIFIFYVWTICAF